MNRHTLTFSFCFFFSVAALFACAQDQKKEGVGGVPIAHNVQSADSGQIAPKMVSTKNSQMALKNWNEEAYRLPNIQHRKNIQILSQQFPDTIFYKGKPKVKMVALTFDDGPDNYYTPRILNILHNKGVPGTFFIVGRQAKSFPNMLRRIVWEGNAIGNHSWDHPKFWKISNDQMAQEIISTENEIQKITGHRSDLFRPPYGRVTPEEVVLIHNLGYRIIDWSVDTLDWKGTPSPTILNYVNKEVSSGGIILEHCLAGRTGELNGTLQALPQIIDQLRAQGYQFVTVQTLLRQ